MAITIAGVATQVGDELWHNGLGLWAQVTEPGIVTIKGKNDQVAKYAFTTGGYIYGRKVLAWHQPLVFESSKRDISQYQELLDKAHSIFGD